MRRPMLLVVALVMTMLAWSGYIAWVSRQAASASSFGRAETYRHADRVEQAIRMVDREMTSQK